MDNTNLDSVVLTARYNPAPVRRESKGIDTSSMAFISVNATLPSNIPYL